MSRLSPIQLRILRRLRDNGGTLMGHQLTSGERISATHMDGRHGLCVWREPPPRDPKHTLDTWSLQITPAGVEALRDHEARS